MFMNKNDHYAIKALYQQTRTEQPSAELDRRIQHAAYKAATKDKSRWIWPLSTAAIFMLSLNVVLNLYDVEQSSVEDLIEEKSSAKELKQIQRMAPVAVMKKPQQSSQATISSAESIPETISPFAEREHSKMEIDVVRDSQMIQPDQLGNQLNIVSDLELKTKKRTEKQQRQILQSRMSLAREKEQRNMGMSQLQNLKPSMMDSASEPPKKTLMTPELPETLQQLLDLAEGLTGEQRSEEGIRIYAGKRLILSLTRHEGHVLFIAYQGSEELGVQVDWLMEPNNATECESTAQYIQCQLNSRVSARFIQQKLESVRWQQPIKEKNK